MTAPVVLDARGAELGEALVGHPLVVKPNRKELSQTVGRDLPDEKSLEAAMRELNDRGAGWVVVSEGVGPVRVSGEGKVLRFEPPPAEAVNPIGCGDCLAAGIARTIARGGDVVEGVRRGIAAAVDSLQQILPARLDPNRVAGLVDLVKRV